MSAPLLAWVEGPDAPRVFGLLPRERLARQAAKAGFQVAETPKGAELLLSASHVYGGSVLASLASAAPGVVLKDDSGLVAGARLPAAAEIGAKAGPEAKSGAELAGRYDKQLRKRADPIVRAIGDDPRPAEQEIFDATYKGVTDFVTKHVWPVPALHAVRLCVRFGLTPNQVTLASLALVLIAMWLFWTGSFLTGLAVAWVMTFLDTVDGKLARATLTSSKIGDVLDHGIDLIHPPFWWWAWGIGLGAAPVAVDPALGVILVGYVAQRLIEGLFIARFRIEMHIWRPFDSFFRKITARRNPNLVILTAATLLGAPDIGFVLVAAWVAVGLVVHGVQIVQGFAAARRAPLTSWLADQSPN